MPGDRAALALLLAAGLIVRILVAVGSEVWLDEANGVLIASAPIGDLARVLRPDSSPPLYYLILKGWISVFSAEPASLRTLSLIFGALGLAALHRAATRLDGPRAAAIAVGLAALHPLHVLYSEEIRMYGLLFALGALFLGTSFGSLREDGRWIGTALVGSALAYTHYYGLVFAGASLALVWTTEPARRRQATLAGLGIALAFLPWLPVFLEQASNPVHVSWIAPFWERYPPWAAPLRSLQAFVPGGTKFPFLPLDGLPLQPLVLGVAALPLAASWRSRPPRAAGLAAAALAVTLLALWAWSFASRPIYLAGRSDVVVLPAFLFVVAAIASRGGRRVAAATVVVWAGLSAADLAASAERLPKTGNAAIESVIEREGCRVVVATGLAYGTTRYASIVAGTPARVLAFPAEVAAHPGNFDETTHSGESLEVEARDLARTLRGEPGVCLLAEEAAYAAPLLGAFLEEGQSYPTARGLRLSLLERSYRLIVVYGPQSRGT